MIGGLILNIFDGFCNIFIGRTGYAFTAHFYVWPDSNACIGDQVTSNGVRVILGQSDLIVGRDTMISDEVLLQTIDQHGIVDIDSMEIINLGRRRTMIGEHVWVGRRSTIMRDVSVGNGSVIAAGAMVTSNVEKMTVVAGIPARVLRQGTSWSRLPTKISLEEAAFFRENQKAKVKRGNIQNMLLRSAQVFAAPAATSLWPAYLDHDARV